MFLSKRIKLGILLLLLVFGTFLFLTPAHAIIGTGIFDWSSAVLDALDTIDQAILSFLIKLIIFSFVSAGFVMVSAALLQWAITLPLNISNAAVLGGWNFVLGLVNLGFVLSFIFIALTYILRLPQYEMKKTLPRLILVILLVNFSMLLVGMLADVSQFVTNTLLDAFGGDFVKTATMPLKQNLGAITNVIIMTVTAYIASAFTVFGAPIALALLAYQTFSGNLLGDIFALITMIAMNAIMGAIFFIYTVLYIVRIAALWILAIFSPLAFFCLIFDQTKKYFSSWFKMVVGWAFLGVVALFLMGLIISLYTDAFFSRPGNIVTTSVPGLPGIRLPSSMYNYIFLLCFLAVAFYISINYVPAGADRAVGFISGKFKAMGGVTGVINKGRRATGEIARKAVPEKTRKVMRQWAATPTRNKQGKLLPTASSIKEVTEKGGVKGALAQLSNPYMKRQIGKKVGAVTYEADRRVTNETAEKTKGKSSVENLTALRSTHDPAKQLGYLKGIMDNGQLGDVMNEKIVGEGNTLKADKRVLESAYLASVRQVRDPMRKQMERSFKDTIGAERFKEIQQSEGYYTKKDEEKDKEKGYVDENGKLDYNAKIIGEAKEENKIKQLEKGWHKDDKSMDAVHKLWEPRQVKQAAGIFGREFIERLEETKKSPGWYYAPEKATRKARNKSMPRWYASSAASSLGVSPLRSKTGKVLQGKDVNNWERESLEMEKEAREKWGERAERKEDQEENREKAEKKSGDWYNRNMP